MQVWRSLEQVEPGQRSVVTVGNFDGVHRGHARVLCARELTTGFEPPADVVVVTFDPHPMQVLLPERAPARLTDIPERVDLLLAAGADRVLVLPFDPGDGRLAPEHFVRRVLIDALAARAVVVGANFRFGARASGDVTPLRRLGEEYGFAVTALELSGGAQTWSSTAVRAALAEGDVRAAAEVLGRLPSVSGVVVEGDHRGRRLGYPTANVPTDGLVAVPADGVYAGWLRRLDLPQARLPAAISVGTNPTFDGVERRVESYVLDRDDLELYGVPVEVAFVRRLRGQVRFDSVAALVDQMRLDVDSARSLLG